MTSGLTHVFEIPEKDNTKDRYLKKFWLRINDRHYTIGHRIPRYK